MEANNAVSTEQAVETNQAVNTDTLSTTDSNAIDAGDTATGEQSSSEVSTDQTNNVEELFYDIQGEEVSHSTVMDWKNGHLMQADYTNKSKANAEEKKGLEAKHVLANEKIDTLSSTISKLEESIKAELNSEELEELRDTDIAEFTRRKEALEAKSIQAKNAKADLDARQTKEDQERGLVERELLIDSQTTWSDPVKMEADIKMVETFVNELQLNDKDYQSLGSHKLMNMALDAARYQSLQANAEETEKQIQKAPNVIKATVKQSKKPQSTLAKRMYPNMN